MIPLLVFWANLEREEQGVKSSWEFLLGTIGCALFTDGIAGIIFFFFGRNSRKVQFHIFSSLEML